MPPLSERDLENAVTQIFSWLDRDFRPVIKKSGSDRAFNAYFAPKPSSFQNIDAVSFCEDHPDWFVFNPHETTPDILWPVDAGFASVCDGNLFEQKRHATSGLRRLVCTHGYTVLPKDVRGKASVVVPKMLRLDYLHAQDDGQIWMASQLFGYIAGVWRDLQPNHGNVETGRATFSYSPIEREDDHFKAGMTIGIALRHRYEWSVSIGRPGMPSFRFATDPTGIRSLFTMRDAPDAGRRRSALRNWVTSHWRQARANPNEEIYVRQHLRGSVSFAWREYVCTVRPSAFDLERNESLRAERALMGKQARRNASRTNLTRCA